jgi:glycosyltransferase involved in cell wall biosynthesis
MTKPIELPNRVGIQQRVLPAYRAAFFDALAGALPGTLSVFAGEPFPGENIPQAGTLARAKRFRAGNRRIGWGRFSLIRQDGWRQWLAAEDPQLAVLEANPKYISNYRIGAWMRSRGQPVIGWSLGPGRASAWLTGRMHSFYNGFSALIVYSRSGADAFRGLGIAAERIFVAPNAVSSATAQKLLARPAAREEARAEWNLDARPLVLFVGRLQRRKRIDMLLRACAGAGAGCQLLIVGDGGERGALERLAGGIFPDARFAGDLRGDALGRCFLAADLFVMPGTGGLALQEAMLYGKAVAAAEADGSQRDLIRPGENGWLLPPGDPAALQHVLKEAIADPDRLATMGRASQRIVLETATLERMTGGFLEAIRFALRPEERKR